MGHVVEALFIGLLALVAATRTNAEPPVLPAPPVAKADAAATPPIAITATRSATSGLPELESTDPEAADSYAVGQTPPRRPPLTFRKLSNSVISATSLNGQVRVRLEAASGAAMFPTGRNAFSPFLSPTVNWRNAADFSLTAPLGSDSSLSVTVGASNMRGPLLAGAGRGLGEATRWTEHRAVDIDMKLSLFDDRLTYSGGLGWSNYRAMRTTRFTEPDDPFWRAPQFDSGTSYWHRVDGKLSFGSHGGASAYVVVGHQSDGYRGGRFSTLPLIFDGQTFEAGGKLVYGKASLSLDHQDVRGTYWDSLETTARLDVGGIRLTHVTGKSAYDIKLDGEDFQSDSQYRKTSLRLDVATVLGDELGGWAPKTVTLRSDKYASRTGDLQSAREKIGISLGWSGKSSSKTALGIARVTRTSHLLGVPRPPAQEMLVDASHSRSFGPLDLSAYGAIAVDRSSARSRKSSGGSLSASLNVPDLPRLSLSVSYNDFDLDDHLTPDLRDRSLSISASADLAPWLKKVGMPQGAYLKVRGYADWRHYRFGPLPTDEKIEPGVMIMFGMPF